MGSVLWSEKRQIAAHVIADTYEVSTDFDIIIVEDNTTSPPELPHNSNIL